jgi:hypothetical protein
LKAEFEGVFAAQMRGGILQINIAFLVRGEPIVDQRPNIP